METFTISKKKIEEMFQHYIERKKYKQQATGDDTIWAAGECEEAEKWLSLFGVDLDYFRIQDMVNGNKAASAIPDDPTFYGKNCNYAFHPVLSGDDWYDTVLYTGKDTPYMARFHSMDECVLWALYKLETIGEKEFSYFTVVGPAVRIYDEYEQLILDAWDTLTDINVDDDECTEQDWFLFPAGTSRENIWHWFDEHYEKGVSALLYGQGEFPIDEIPCKSIELKLPAGTFRADIETTEETLHNSIYLSFLPYGTDETIDIAAVRDIPSDPGEKGIEVLFFGDLQNEDPTEQIVFSRREIEEALNLNSPFYETK